MDKDAESDVFAGFLTTYDEVILPSLSLMPNNCCMSEEIWGFIKLLKYEHRCVLRLIQFNFSKHSPCVARAKLYISCLTFTVLNFQSWFRQCAAVTK